MRHIDDTERRTRLAMRHGLHPAHRVADMAAATRAMTVLHATEAATVYLSTWARVESISVEAIDQELYADRSLLKQLAMRRTLFVLPRDLLPAALGSASARVAAEQRRLVTRDVEKHGLAPDGHTWLETARGAVVARLTGSPALTAQQLREQVPELTGTTTTGLDKKYGGTFQIAPRVLTTLGAEGILVRGANAGHWRISRPSWTLMSDWLGEQVTPRPAPEGYAELVRRWLYSFGPGTTADLQWWLGSTKAAVVEALTTLGAVQVSLERGDTGWLLPDDVDPPDPVEPWAALLPTLDPTTMGWKGRGFYLDPELTPYLFDRNGNGGNTAWWDGRIVGAWVQDEGGVVQVVLAPGMDALVSAEGRRALDAQAQRLSEWLDGVRITNVYKSQLMKQQPLP